MDRVLASLRAVGIGTAPPTIPGGWAGSGAGPGVRLVICRAAEARPGGWSSCGGADLPPRGDYRPARASGRPRPAPRRREDPNDTPPTAWLRWRMPRGARR